MSSRRSQRQRISPSPEPQPITAVNQLSSLELPHSSLSPSITGIKFPQIPSTASVVYSPIASHSNPLSDRSKMTNNHLQTPTLIDQQKLALSDSVNNANGEYDINSLDNSSPSTLLHKKDLSASDLNPFERKKKAALAKVEAKLEKAQLLHQSAQQSVEQTISEFLRVTTIPGILNESNSAHISNASFEKRIRGFQDTKKRIEKKIANYQADIARIQHGDITEHCSSSKELFINVKNKVTSTNSKHRSTNDVPTPVEHEQSYYPESDNNHHSSNLSATSVNALDIMRSSPSSSTSNDVGSSHIHTDSNPDLFTNHRHDKSPSTKRRSTGDSHIDNERLSNHSSDDRFYSHNPSKRNTIATNECNLLIIKIDEMQTVIDRDEIKINEMQKQIDSLLIINDSQHEQNKRLNNELTDLTDLHQIEMSSMKNDLRKLENRLLYNFNENWTNMAEKLEELDTRTAKVEQTQTHSLETEENTHRVISKLVNIVLTLFAIILLVLSTIKNLVQSRVHAVILLILVFIWITIHYLPPNYFQTPFFTNFTSIFKQT